MPVTGQKTCCKADTGFSRRQAEHKKKPLKMSSVVKEALKLLRATLPATIDLKENIEALNSFIMADADPRYIR